MPPVRVAAATVPPPGFSRPAEARLPVTTAPAPSQASPLAQPQTQAAVGPAFASLAIKPTALPPTVTSSSGASPGGVSAPSTAAALVQPGPAVTAAQPPASALELARQAQQAQRPVTSPGVAAGPAATVPPVAGAPAPALIASGPPPPEPRRDLAAAFSDFRPPAEEQLVPVAVDISKLPARTKKSGLADERGPIPDAPTGTRRSAAAEPAVSTLGRKLIDPKTGKAIKAPDKTAKTAKPVVPSHPSRIWVQLGVGRNKDALGFDWRKLGKAQADLFKGRKPWTTPWGQTNRLLVGPFETQAAASAFLKEARKKEGDAFVWTSPAGQAIDALVAK